MIVTTLDPAHVDTPDFDSAFIVAEFMLNLLPVTKAPARREVEAYINRHFKLPSGDYRFPVHQDFLQVRTKRKAGIQDPARPPAPGYRSDGTMDYLREATALGATRVLYKPTLLRTVGNLLASEGPVPQNIAV